MSGSFSPNAPVTGALQRYEQELARLCNEPRPYLPDWFVKELTAIDGRDIVSGKPNYRIVWGQHKEAMKMYVENDVTVWRPNYLKGYFTQVIRLDVEGLAVAPVIEKSEPVGMPCYFIEKYIPARNISMDLWEKSRWFYPDLTTKVDLMGPFPEEGHYVEFRCLMNPQTKEVIKPCQAVLDEIRAYLSHRDEDARFDALTPRDQILKILTARREQELKEDLSYITKLAEIRKFYKAGMCGDASIGVLTNNLQPLAKAS